MLKCSICKKDTTEDSKCPVCKKIFCEEHVFPEAHKCKVKHKTETAGINLAFIIIFLIIGLTILFYLAIQKFDFDIPFFRNTESDSNLTQEIAKARINKTIEANISYRDYFDNETAYIGKDITLYGFLYKFKINNGVFPYIRDEYNNKISLRFNTTEQANAFDKANPEQIYEIKGVLKTKFDGMFIEVNSITPSRRPTITVEVEAP